jgi:hypothetical protein
MSKKIVYLAVPYSHEDEKIREERFLKVNKVAARLLKEGLTVFSPISHSHPIAMAENLPTDFDFWVQFDTAFLSHSKKLIVLMLDGWKESKGVIGEIKIAQELNIPIEYINE